MDHTFEYMKKNGVPLTREDYLDYAYLGNPPEHLTAEEEAQLPEQFREQPHDSEPSTFKAANAKNISPRK